MRVGILFALLLSTQLGLGQYHFRTLDVNDGLSSNSVYNIFEDSQGYIWFATINGLNRYDGQRIRVFTPKLHDSTSIPFSSIRCITEDRNHLIWVGGREGKVASYDSKTDRFKSFELTHSVAFSEVAVWDVIVDRDNTKWFVTRDELYVKVDDSSSIIPFKLRDTSGQFVSGKGLGMFSILQDSKSDNLFWIGTTGGKLLAVDINTHQVIYYETPGGVDMPDLYMHINGKLYATSDDGLVLCFDPGTHHWRKYVIKGEVNNSATQIIGISNDELLVATVLKGLIVLNVETGEYRSLVDYEGTKYSLGNSILYSLLKDHAGNIWVGTRTDGVRVNTALSHRFKHWVLPPSFYKKYLNNQSYKETFIHDFYELDSHNILFSIYNYPYVFKSDNNFNHVTRLTVDRNLPNIHFYEFRHAGGVFGIWSSYGFVRIDTSSLHLSLTNHYKEFKQYNVSGRLLDTLNQKYWFTIYSQNGCGSYDPKADEITIYPDSSNPGTGINTMPKCYNGKIWFATGAGIKSFDPGTHEFTFIPNANISRNIPFLRVHSLEFFDDSIMLIGGLGFGIFKYNIRSNKVVDRYLQKDGLLSNQIMRFRAADKERLVYLSYAGMGIMNMKLGPKNQLTYHEKDGLLNDYFGLGFHKKTGGEFHLGGDGFFTKFNIHDFPRFSPGLKLRFESIRIGDDSTIYNINHTRNVELASNQNFLTISYAINEIFTDQPVRFEYRLSGVDTRFISTDKYNVSYTNLPPGKYKFIIRPIFQNGAKSEYRQLSFYIRPRFWQTLWFKWLFGLLFAGMVWFLYRYRIALIRREEATKRKLETRIKEIEMVALRSQMNPHFLFNSLNSIKSFIARQEPRKATNFLSKFAQLMRYILANSEQSAIPLSKEIDAIKLYLDLESMRFSNKFDYEIKVAPDVMVESIVIQPLILQPYIENAIWHGLLPLESKGRIEIAIDKQEDMLRITIYDNGIGRKASLLLQKDSVRKRKSYGIRITSDRIKHFSEKSSVQILDMQDEQGELRGTKVVIVIPIRFVTKDEE